MQKIHESIDECLLRIDWPHSRNGVTWKKSSQTFKRALYFAKKLSKLGLDQSEIATMFADLYWDAFEEFKKMPKATDNDRGELYFDKHQIRFRLDESKVSAEELKRDFYFDSNLIIEGEKVWRTISGGRKSGGPLYHFLNVFQVDKTYAFGPTKKQKGWPSECLEKFGAVGLYKLKSRLGKPPRKTSR